MTRRKILLLLLVAGVVGAVCIGRAVGQDGGSGGRGGWNALTDEERAQRMEEWRARMSEQLRERVGATEEEWEDLSPLIDEVQSLSRQVQTGTRNAMFGRGGRGRRSGGDESESDDEPTDIEAAAQALQELVDDESATSAQLNEAIEALRAAKAVVEAELDEAKRALRSAVTMRQDAQLVLMGLLD